jgi:hypothetical protein
MILGRPLTRGPLVHANGDHPNKVQLRVYAIAYLPALMLPGSFDDYLPQWGAALAYKIIVKYAYSPASQALGPARAC